MNKFMFNIYALISSIKYYIYRLFYFGNGFKRLPFHSYNASKIYNWQRKEDVIWARKEFSLDPGRQLLELQEIRYWVVTHIKYVKDAVNYDKKEYWAAIDEVIMRGTGDCEDQAFVMYKMMLEAGFPRDKVGIVCVKGHAFACYHFIKDDFYILDNGYLTSRVVKASKYFKDNEKVRPIVGFNISNQWSYR